MEKVYKLYAITLVAILLCHGITEIVIGYFLVVTWRTSLSSTWNSAKMINSQGGGYPIWHYAVKRFFIK